MGPDVEPTMNILFALWKDLQKRWSTKEPRSPPEKRAKQIHLKSINEMVHLVHEPKGGEKPQLEVVFFHGLELENSKQSHVKTWMSRDDSEFWLQTWLAESFPNSRILTVSYDTSGPLDMFRLVENLLVSLTMGEDRVGKAGCPVVFVGHCVGGLILKELCLFASDRVSQNDREKLGVRSVDDLFSNLKGMFFYGTPQTGSMLGDMLHDLFQGDGAPIEEIEILKASSARRNEQFDNLKSRRDWVTFGIGETRETFLQTLGVRVHVSPEASTRPYMDQHYSVDADHYDICKPKERIDTAFLSLQQFLRQILKGGVLGAGNKADLISGREYVVDHEGRAKKLKGLLSKADIHTVFVVGLSGVGKTSVAQQVFHDLSNRYDLLCFVSLDQNPGEVSDQFLKEQTVTRIVRQFGEVDRGFEQNRSRMIYHLKGRKVLMVLDNVESEVQLKALSIEEWLEGSSSKLIVTTNSPSFNRPTSAVFEVEYMSGSESKELFSHYAFDGQEAPDHLKQVIQQVIDKCNNHPLALKVLGAFIENMGYLEEGELLEVVSKLEKAEEVDGGRDCMIWGKLKVCYDDLPPSEKEMFLDIALFFHGSQLSLVECIWSRCMDSRKLSWRNLKKRFLVSTNWKGDCIQMHQLLRNLGQSIACPSGTSIDKWTRIPEASSRWEDIEDVEGKMETFALKVKPVQNIMLEGKSFLKFHRLRYLILAGVGTAPERVELPRSLVYLRLEDGLFTACPVDFSRLRKLVVLELVRCTSMEFLPDGLVTLKELTWLELEGCLKLSELPLGLSEQLKYLGLDGTFLEKLPEDIGRYKQLCHLELHSPHLTQVPEGVGNLKSLLKLDLSSSKVTCLPESIGGLKQLKEFFLGNTSLSSLPNSIGELRELEELNLEYTCLKGLPPSVGDLCKLQFLVLDETPLESLPYSIGKLRSLQCLCLRGTQMRSLPSTIGDLNQLSNLSVSSTKWIASPESLGTLQLEWLEAPVSSFWGTSGAAWESEEVEGRKGDSLQPNLTLEEEKSQAEASRALSSWSEEIEDQEEPSFRIPLDETSQFKMFSLMFDKVRSLTLNGRCCPHSWLLPLFLAMQQKSGCLQYLKLKDFILAEEIPSEIGKLTSLEDLAVTGWSRLRELPQSLGELSRLSTLRLVNNPKLFQLPECFGLRPTLMNLEIVQCGLLQSIPRSFCIGFYGTISSDSWRVLESFFMCCQRVTNPLLDYGSKRGYDEAWSSLEKKIVMERFNEECLHHRTLDHGDRSVDDASEPLTSVSLSRKQVAIKCGFHNKTLVLTEVFGIPLSWSLKQEVHEGVFVSRRGSKT